MTRSLIRYKTKPEMADENERLIKDVFKELHAKSPKGVRYMAVRLGDGTFIHFVAVDTKDAGSAIPALEAFRSFQKGIRERCIEPPQQGDANIVGNYRMLDE